MERWLFTLALGLAGCSGPSDTPEIDTGPFGDLSPEPPPLGGNGRVLLASWPPSTEGVFDVVDREWIGVLEGGQFGRKVLPVPDLYGPGDDGLLVWRLDAQISTEDRIELYDLRDGGRDSVLLGSGESAVHGVYGTGDLDGDGHGELVVLFGAAQQPRLSILSGAMLVVASEAGDVETFTPLSLASTTSSAWAPNPVLGPPWTDGGEVRVAVGNTLAPGIDGEGRGLVDVVALAPDTAGPTLSPTQSFRTNDRYDGLGHAVPLSGSIAAVLDDRHRVADTRVGRVGVFDGGSQPPGDRDVDAAAHGVIGSASAVLSGPLTTWPDVDGDGVAELVVPGAGGFLSSTVLSGPSLGASQVSVSGLGLTSPDIDGDGLPESFASNRLVLSSELAWEGESVTDRPAVWEGGWGLDHLTYVDGYGIVRAAFLHIDGQPYIVAGVAEAL